MTYFTHQLTTPPLPDLILIFSRDFPTAEYMLGKCNCGDPAGEFKAWARGPVRDNGLVIYEIRPDGISQHHDFEWETEVIHDHSLELAFSRVIGRAMELVK